ncbi:YhcB family protein [Idiomarina aminovorans]|uniref:YhcB family protein n=1 Tax=Idiomarina aminovorans TaxID=2914829 RepID=UPI002005EBC6|nr:YhcB family protein [Idiomarina sp. ATCH4]MCK7459003.1 YhcB family protein [Idiomarina sp. ATCH4]
MSWIIGILLVIAGAIIGFFAARYSQSKGQSGDLEEQVEQSQQRLTDYQREVSEHFITANAMVEQLADTQQRLQSYLNQSAELLEKSDTQSDLPFFAEDTIKQLRVANSLNKDHRSGRDSYSGNDIPRDYTEGSSGLFSNSYEEKFDEDSGEESSKTS